MAKVASIPALATIAGSSKASAFRRPSGPEAAPAAAGRVPLWELLETGQILELSGRAPGKLSTVARLIKRAQALSEPTAFLSLREGSSFYPPDFARVGIDLTALLVVRVPEAVGPYGVVRAAEVLMRSGAFGVLILDLSHGVPKGELTWQSRLSGLARLHDVKLVLLTASSADEPSLGPLVSLRIAPELRMREGRSGALLAHRVLKSKLGQSREPSPDVRALPEGAMRP